MAECSDLPRTETSSCENSHNADVGEDSMKSIRNQIISLLQLDRNDNYEEIVNNILENGRQSLVNYQDDIKPKIYRDVMNGSNDKLIILLKNYFQQKWEIEYSNSNPWFIAFLKQYGNGENHDRYERVLTRTAKFGNKYMKDCPVLSIVLQLLFQIINDKSLTISDIFNDLWFTITNDGLKSVTQHSTCILKDVLNEQLKMNQLILFQALREYYRQKVFSLLKESDIVYEENLYNVLLDNVAKHGWLADMKPIENNMTSESYQILLDKLHSNHRDQKGSKYRIRHIRCFTPATPKRPSAPTHPRNSGNLM
ncbi:unnamed protein product [Didymodactylos carnosus]|uniref:Uncharacterized protein n=1 Tax=Didymodactylos carnosus TaxID=1234261 RepID=A0A814S576_9BILA|nr:unnamed protein product [Didymodactylos carnosus]CAF1387355.1 unnamed protein product [Didymodactylos carnosus]CAF3905903.1 unnamed protein product [Didymodactylos carnosus]CAF4195184.1 unnamed protein product [Didymodactylos carnosus]